MKADQSIHITKSDFLLYFEAPRHLWAKINGQIENTLSDFNKHLIDEGYEVEKLGHAYLESVLLSKHPNSRLLWQKTYADGPFEARLDALVHKLDTNTYDLYEIKSATNLDKEHYYDVAYQALILQKQIKVDDYFLLHLNKEYVRMKEIDLAQLFIAVNISNKVLPLLPEIAGLRQEALQSVEFTDPGKLGNCRSPKTCPCTNVCHPDLPEFSIYDIPYLSPKKKAQLLSMGIKAAKDIPLDFDLNDKQILVVERSRKNTEFIDQAALRADLQKLQYPLWFLDYETCISAIPRFDGYHPQQQMVFQYSLHMLENPGGILRQSNHIALTDKDPSLSLLEHLTSDLGPNGTVIVWNKTFEMTMNKDMGLRYPEYAEFLQNLNSRIYDLGEIVNRGIYLHPGFKGSWSIKNVLPVLVPGMTYSGMTITSGDQASTTWWNITFNHPSESEKQQLVDELLKYCEMDTKAMVEIYNRFNDLSCV